MNKFIMIFCFVFVLGTLTAEAQEKSCGQADYYTDLIKQFPFLEAMQYDYETQVRNALQNIDWAQARGTGTYLDTTTPYQVALVFHVLHTYNEKQQDWVSDASVMQCVDVINKDYNGSYPDTAFVTPYYKNKVGNGRITFKLANKDPYGNCSNGIDRIHTYKAPNGGDAAKLNQWPTDVYVNIWLAGEAGNPGAAAYAIKPPTASALPYLDGIMSDRSYANGLGAGASTISHELGHIFNLDHLWGGTNNPEVGCGDDGVYDTPPTKGHRPGNCPLAERETQCWDSMSVYFLDPNCVSNTQNIMEYSFCDRMFTIGQMKRVRTCMQNFGQVTNNGFRDSLVKARAHNLAGINVNTPTLCNPIADFYANRLFVVGNKPVQLKNFTYNTPLTGATYSWSMPNATPSTSTTANNVNITYDNVTGWQDVTLTATVAGRPGTSTKSSFIYVQSPTPNNAEQTFEDTIRNAKWPIFNYYHNMFRWTVSSVGAKSGSKCMSYLGYDNRSFPAKTIGTAIYDNDDFYTEVYDLTGFGAPRLNFWLAGASTTSDYNSISKDNLQIQYSTNGGTSWININTSTAKLEGPELYPNGVVSNMPFTPSGYWDYTPVSILLPASVKTANTVFRFSMSPGNYSNNVYLDDISVGDWVTGISNQKNEDFRISPNPVHEGGQLTITSSISMKGAKVNITDLTGRVIFTDIITDTNPYYQIDYNKFPAQGLYLINITMDNSFHTEKINVM